MHILLVPSEYPTADHKLGGIFTKEQENYLRKYHKVGVLYVYLFSIKKLFSYLFFKVFTYKIKKRFISLLFSSVTLFKVFKLYNSLLFF